MCTSRNLGLVRRRKTEGITGIIVASPTRKVRSISLRSSPHPHNCTPLPGSSEFERGILWRLSYGTIQGKPPFTRRRLSTHVMRFGVAPDSFETGRWVPRLPANAPRLLAAMQSTPIMSLLQVGYRSIFHIRSPYRSPIHLVLLPGLPFISVSYNEREPSRPTSTL